MAPMIGYHRQTAGKVTSTQIISITVETPGDAIQLGLFAKEDWEREMLDIIAKFKEFFPSEVSLLCRTLPPHDNCVGPFYKKLLEKRRIEQTGTYRRSRRSLRKGSLEFQYRNIGV